MRELVALLLDAWPFQKNIYKSCGNFFSWAGKRMGAAKGREIGIKSKCHAQPQEEREMAIGMDHNGSWWGDMGGIVIYLPPFSNG